MVASTWSTTSPKVEIKVIAQEIEAEEIATTILETARAARIGDGKVWIQPLEMVARIRTGEPGDDAI